MTGSSHRDKRPAHESNTAAGIGGVLPAVITPLRRDDRLDEQAFERHLRNLLDAGVHGLFIGGTAGEGPYITPEERAELWQVATATAGDEIRLVVAFLQPDTRSVLRAMQQFAQRQGRRRPDFVSAITPLYYPMDQTALIAHFEAIAEEAPAPLIIYNIPGNTHNPLTLDTLMQLGRHPRIAGVKESSGDFALFSQGVLNCDRAEFAWIQGKDLLDGPALMIGAPALITGLGNVWIEPYLELYQAATKHAWDEVDRYQRLINGLSHALRSAGVSPLSATKSAACKRLGIEPVFRVPGLEPEPQLISTIFRRVSELSG